jgi:hypothetical protein
VAASIKGPSKQRLNRRKPARLCDILISKSTFLISVTGENKRKLNMKPLTVEEVALEIKRVTAKNE